MLVLGKEFNSSILYAQTYGNITLNLLPEMKFPSIRSNRPQFRELLVISEFLMNRMTLGPHR